MTLNPGGPRYESPNPLDSLDSIRSFDDITSLVGVIDIKDGVAVHAAGGKRERYQAVDFCSGNPALLLDHYARLGIRRFYVADLDAITRDQPNANEIGKLATNCSAISDCIELIFDLGWRGRDCTNSGLLIRQLNKQFRHCQWIAATEAMPNPSAISDLAEMVGIDRTIVSLDYRNGRLLGGKFDEQDWLVAATGAGVLRFVVLDLAAVGSDQGPTTGQICERIATTLTDPQIYSGGGIRSISDIDALKASGCNFFLLATSLHPKGKPARRIS